MFFIVWLVSYFVDRDAKITSFVVSGNEYKGFSVGDSRERKMPQFIKREEIKFQ